MKVVPRWYENMSQQVLRPGFAIFTVCALVAVVTIGLLVSPTTAVKPIAETGMGSLEFAQLQKQNCQLQFQAATTSGERTRAQQCITIQDKVIARLNATPSPTSTPTPTVTPTPTPTATPPTDPTPTPSSSSSPSPTSLLTNCFPKLAECDYVHAGNTGVPPGTTLISMGSAEIRTAGQIIDSRLIDGFLKILAPDVIIRNSKIVQGDNFWAVDVEGSGSVTIEDTEIDCVGGTGTGVTGSNYTVRRTHLHDCENAFHSGSNVTIEDNYIDGIREVNGGHGDGIQGSSASNVTVRHNTFDLFNPITSSIIWDNLTISNVLIENNFFAAGAYSVYCPTGGTNLTYRNNRFYGPVGNWQSDPHRPAFGFSTNCGRSAIIWTNNFRDDTLGVVNP